MTATKKSKTRAKVEHAFSLILGGATGPAIEIEDALFEAGCDDALLGTRDGVMFLDFERASKSLMEAVLSAVADVQRAKIGLWVARVEPDDLVSAAEIARRVQRSRESIRQLMHGERGPGEFPPPMANLTRRSPIWRWTEVASWFEANYGGLCPSDVQDAADVAAINAALELRRNVRDVSLINRLWSSAASSPHTAKLRFELQAQPSGRKRAARKKAR